MNAPLLSLPISVMVLDDNVAFLKGLGAHFEGKRPYLLADDPEKAAEILHSKEYFSNSLRQHIKSRDAAESDEDTDQICFDFESLQQTLYNPNRFNEIGAVVVDYSMPDISGLAFCRQIKNLPIKKIMVTGHASHDLAVEAFNEGVIDAFILKEPANITEKVEGAVSKMQARYFNELTQTLFTEPLAGPTRSDAYKAILQRFVEENNLVEYYRLNLNGSYLGLDADGKAYWLVNQSEKELDNLIDIAQSSDTGSDVVEVLQSRSHLLFLLTEADKKRPVSDWNKFLFPVAETYEHEKKAYFTSVIKDNYLALDKAKIESFKEHLESN